MLPWIDTVCYGPITRTVRDAALFLDVVAGPDPRDPDSLPPAGLSYEATLERIPARLPIARQQDPRLRARAGRRLARGRDRDRRLPRARARCRAHRRPAPGSRHRVGARLRGGELRAPRATTSRRTVRNGAARFSRGSSVASEVTPAFVGEGAAQARAPQRGARTHLRALRAAADADPADRCLRRRRTVPARDQRRADPDGARRGRVHVPVQLLRPPGRRPCARASATRVCRSGCRSSRRAISDDLVLQAAYAYEQARAMERSLAGSVSDVRRGRGRGPVRSRTALHDRHRAASRRTSSWRRCRASPTRRIAPW